MSRSPRPPALPLVLAFALTASVAVNALELEALTPRFGLVLVANGVPTSDSAAGPISGTLGLDFALPLSPASIFAFEPGFDVYSFHSELLSEQPLSGPVLDLPRAVPAAVESAASSWTAGLLLSAPMIVRPRLPVPFTPVFGAGPALLLRLAVGGQTPLELDAWFLGKARWLYAEARMGMELELGPGMSLVADVRGFYPLANLWTDPDPAMAMDGAMLRIGLGMRLALGRSPEPEAALAPESEDAAIPSPENPVP
ncbi:MAG: hypothetical protein JXA15_04370 [Spirochaetales bacterium]|nr:hypothetical protein [Spirochaetales bacterium]